MTTAVRLIFAFLTIGMLAWPAAASAQATPEVAPSDQACKSVKPIGLLDLLNLVGDLDRASNSDKSLTVEVAGTPTATGPEISRLERDQIQTTLDALISCVNQRDPLRIVALLSDRFKSLLVLDLVGGADAMSVVANQIPDILDAPDRSEPIPSPTIVKAWHPSDAEANIDAIVSIAIPGHEDEVQFLLVFVPGEENNWKIDEIARYQT
jgi:hypothetical protein